MKTLSLLFQSVLITAAASTQTPDWSWQNPHPQGTDLFAVSVVDANNGWVAGDSGVYFYRLHAEIISKPAK